MTQPTGPLDRRPTRSSHRRAASEPDGGARVIDLADRDWCWSRLCATQRGLLSSRSPRNPAPLDVGYTVRGGRVVIPVADDAEILHLLVGHEVTLELTGHPDDGQRWVVRLTGTADLAVAAMKPSTLHPSQLVHPARGLDVTSSSTLLLPVGRLRGYHETLVDEPRGGGAPGRTRPGAGS